MVNRDFLPKHIALWAAISLCGLVATSCLAAETHSIFGTVTDAEGQPIAGVCVDFGGQMGLGSTRQLAQPKVRATQSCLSKPA